MEWKLPESKGLIYPINHWITVVFAKGGCCCSVSKLCPSLCHPMDCRLPCPSLSSRVCSYSVSSELVMLSNHLIFCHPLLLLPSISPSIRFFSSEPALCIRWPKYWSFSINPSNEYSGLISFRKDWFDLFAIQRTLKRLLQQHNLKASILWHSAFSLVQLLYSYMTTGKSIALTRWTFVGKVMSLTKMSLEDNRKDLGMNELSTWVYSQHTSALESFRWLHHLFSLSLLLPSKLITIQSLKGKYLLLQFILSKFLLIVIIKIFGENIRSKGSGAEQRCCCLVTKSNLTLSRPHGL